MTAARWTITDGDTSDTRRSTVVGIRQVRPARRDTVGQPLGLLAVGRGVKIGDHDAAACGGQLFDGFRTDKPEPAGDKNRVRPSVPLAMEMTFSIKESTISAG